MPPTTTIAGALVRPNRHNSSAVSVTAKAHAAVVKKSGTRHRPSCRASRLTPRLATKAMAEETGPAAEDAHKDRREHAEGHGDHPARERFGAGDGLVQPADGLVAAHSPGHDVRHQPVHLGQSGVVVGPGPHHPKQRDGRLVLGGVVDGHRLVGDVHFDVFQPQRRGDGNDARLHLQGARPVPEHGLGEVQGKVQGFPGGGVHAAHLDHGVGVGAPGEPVHDAQWRRRRVLPLDQAPQHPLGRSILAELGGRERLCLGQAVCMRLAAVILGTFVHVGPPPSCALVDWCYACRFSGSLPSTVRAAATAARARRLAWNASGRTGITKSPSSWTTSPPKPFLNW